MSARFLDAVHKPVQHVVEARRSLITRAEERAAAVKLSAATRIPAAIDVVVAGSGFLSLYYLGVHSVISRLSDCKRYAGASSGAQAPFQLVLAGEEATLDAYLTHGLLHGHEWLASAMFSADQNWKALGSHLVDTHRANLSRLDSVCYVSVSRWTLRGLRNKLYSQWSSCAPEVPAQAFYATGTALAKCDGYYCTDGGVTNNLPVFSDAPDRPQLLVRPFKSGLPSRMAVGYTLDQAVDAIRRGQDDAVSFFEEDDETKRPVALKLQHGS